VSRPSYVRQPGPSAAERVVAVEARGLAFDLDLPAGMSLLGAIETGFAARGFSSGVVEIGQLALSPFAYVMPALSTTGGNAAFYSETFRPEGVTWLEAGALTFGRRDGAPFFHCHALWREADGKRSGGHILPDGTVLAEAARVRAFGIDGAAFEAAHDPETNFKLFGPVPAPSSGAATSARALAVRPRPNQDFAGALAGLLRERGIASARLRGGVGSTIGAEFTDGRVVENFATEVFVRQGHVFADPAETVLDVGLVDHTGKIAEGRLAPGANPVLMTFELVLEIGA
jgi:predicted DNA-binding protein with PD1-like motif